jgi:hypothetical protein
MLGVAALAINVHLGSGLAPVVLVVLAAAVLVAELVAELRSER